MSGARGGRLHGDECPVTRRDRERPFVQAARGSQPVEPVLEVRTRLGIQKRDKRLTREERGRDSEQVRRGGVRLLDNSLLIRNQIGIRRQLKKSVVSLALLLELPVSLD